MRITKHNWSNVVGDALTILPSELRDQLVVTSEHIGSTTCATCHYSRFIFVNAQPVCHLCTRTFGPLVQLDAPRSTLTIRHAGAPLLTAVLIVTPKKKGVPRPKYVVDEVVFFAPDGRVTESLKLNSLKPAFSTERMQRHVRSLTFPAVGLVTDRDGEWGWPRGLRLLGGDMVLRLDEILDDLPDD